MATRSREPGQGAAVRIKAKGDGSLDRCGGGGGSREGRALERTNIDLMLTMCPASSAHFMPVGELNLHNFLKGRHYSNPNFVDIETETQREVTPSASHHH